MYNDTEQEICNTFNYIFDDKREEDIEIIKSDLIDTQNQVEYNKNNYISVVNILEKHNTLFSTLINSNKELSEINQQTHISFNKCLDEHELIIFKLQKSISELYKQNIIEIHNNYYIKTLLIIYIIVMIITILYQ